MKKPLIVLALGLLIGAGCAPSSPTPAPAPTTGAGTSTPPAAASTPYGIPMTFRVNEAQKLDDGLSLKLVSIDDSRCKPGVQCVWAGELSANFEVSAGGTTQDLRLGQTTAPTVKLLARTFTLGAIATDSATITVTK